MTENLFDEFDRQSLSSNRNSLDASAEQTNEQGKTSIPVVVIDSAALTRKDSIVIPSISNGSISSVLQIEHGNANVANSTLLPVCTSNSLGDLSSTPLLLDNPTSTSPVPPPPLEPATTNATSTTFIQCRSFRSDSSSSSKSSASSPQTPVATHELLKNESEEPIGTPVVKKAPAPPPPPPAKRTISESTGENLHHAETDKSSEIYSSDLTGNPSRRALNRQNHQRHGSADLLCRQTLNHEYLNRSSTSTGCSSFYPPAESLIPNAMQFYDYEQNLDYLHQIEEELRQTTEQLNATMRSIKTFWSPELKKERTLRKEESCRYQLLISEHQKRTKQDAHIQTLEHQLRQMRDELERTRQHQRLDFMSIPAAAPIPEAQASPSNNELLGQLQRQCQETKEKLEQRINELHGKGNECVTLKAKVDTYESKEKDLQHYISILKESILIKDQQVTMIQSEIADLRARLKEKDSVIEKKNSKIQSTRLDRQQRESDLQEAKQQLDIRDRKINVLNRKIENLEEQLRDKSTQIATTRAKLTAATSTAAAVPPAPALTTNTLVSNLEATVAEKERLIEKLREQKHSAELEHQEEIEQLQKTILETRTKLEQKEKDYYDGQNQLIELREQLNNCKSILQRREKQSHHLEQQVEQLKKSKGESNDRAKLENDCRTLQDRLSSYELERIEMKREIEWLQQELEQQQKSTPILTESSEDEQQQIEAMLNKKQERIEELEQAVRESLQITTEREYAMTQQKRKVDNFEKQMKTLQNEIEHLRTENHEQSHLLAQLKAELSERKRQYEQRLEEQIKQLDNAFISQQEKLLAELSEKDSHIADLEMDRNSAGAAMRAATIDKLNNEKQQLYNQLKELTEIRMKIIQDHLTAKEEYEQREKSLTSPACV